jgi:GNAT superfamily N-acetyltransferase
LSFRAKQNGVEKSLAVNAGWATPSGVRNSSTALGTTKRKNARKRTDDFRIALARQPAEIARCFEVMRELRPHFRDRKKFLEQVRRQQRDGYLLAFLEVDSEIRAVAGYRFLESLYSGRCLYVDDLVTRERDRSAGYGGKLLDWLVQQARERDCTSFELDSGVQRFDAHRFYFSKRMKICAYHFAIAL